MPCSDQTERLTLDLNSDDCVRAFSLYKLTCHQPVGGSELLTMIRDLPACSLLEMGLDQLISAQVNDVRASMLRKQFFALKGAIAVMYGATASGFLQAFNLHELEFDESGIRLVGEVAVNVIAEKINSCGACRCSS